MRIPIVDSHVHIFPRTHAASLAWQKADGPLYGQYSVDEYRQATESEIVSTTVTIQAKEVEKEKEGEEGTTQPTYELRGFIFVEADRISSLDETAGGWNLALDEVALISRVALGTPLSGEGHRPEDSALCCGIVPWVPLPSGPKCLERYMDVVRKRVGSDDVFQKKICGVRYLLQDKPVGTGLRDEFIEGVKWLGKRRLVFDLAVDTRQGGLWQLKEAVQVIQKAHEGVNLEEEKVVFVIDHLCKPNLQIPCTDAESIRQHPDFVEWKTHITAMAAHPKTYMKLSGSFSELGLPLTANTEPDYDLILMKLEPWTDVVFETFGPERLLFGSDWPVCNISGGGNGVTWQRWLKIVGMILQRKGLTEVQKAGVLGGVAIKAYGLQV